MIIQTLNLDNDLTDSIVVKKLFDYFLIANFSQTYFYTGNVSSLKYLIQEGDSKKENDVIQSITESLENLYGTYYEDVSVKVHPIYAEDTNVYDLEIGVSVLNKDGKTIKLSETINLESPYQTKHIYELKKIKI